MTLLIQSLCDALRTAGQVNHGAQRAPSAILWPDRDSVWLPSLLMLRAELPQLLTLGNYAPDQRQGPAIWLKCAITGRLPDFELPTNTVPIIYLPGVSRADLRAIETCPRELQPLAELQYRGIFWSQASSKDWTIASFLSAARGGLGLTVATDKATQDALLGALKEGVLLKQSLTSLQGRMLDAVWAHGLVAPNAVRDVLTWLNDPDAVKARWGEVRWQVFEKRCTQDYAFSPTKDGGLLAAEKLLMQDGQWRAVWQLYEDSWRTLPGVLGQLMRVQLPATADLFADLSAYPLHNAQQEAALRAALLALADEALTPARAKVLTLQEMHAKRATGVWAAMSLAPLAQALTHLAFVADQVAQLPSGQSLSELARSYTEHFWRVDEAALQAMAVVKTQADIHAVEAVLQGIYRPWLNDAALRLQQVTKTDGGLHDGTPKASYVANGTCYVFIDGLRYDIGQRLVTRLADLGEVKIEAKWTCVPSVTASGKAWASPVAELVQGFPHDQDFEPSVKADEKALGTQRLRKLLSDSGFQVLLDHDLGDAAGKAWVECGDLDHYGHQHGLRLARDIDSQLALIVERLEQLAAHGWTQFKIVTDHGWLLVPGSMPKVHLDKQFAETRWGRCAVLKNTANVDILTLPWDWCADVQIAMAPGIGSFIAGMQYAHGGLSFQESLVPVIHVMSAAIGKAAELVATGDLKWRSLTCHVEILPVNTAWSLDIRTKLSDPGSSLLRKPKAIATGKTTLMVEDEDAEGQSVTVVVLDASGQVIYKLPTVVGHE